MDQLIKFHTHIEPYAKDLLISALRLTGNRFDAEDLLQETLYKAYKNIDKLTDLRNPKGWVFTIMKNTFLNNIRYKNNREILLSDVTRIDRLEDESGEEIDSNELDDEMQSILDDLPVDMRLILIAREIQGLDYDQIAKSMDLPMGTVKSRLKRAREKLKKLWIERKLKK